jgi:hypothetical protein
MTEDTNAGGTSVATPKFDKSVAKDNFKVPQVNLIWRDLKDGPGVGETTKVAFLRQGFVLAVLDDLGNTSAMCFVPRPEARYD